jgi:aryl-alcohol dehydrogenase
MKITAAVSRGSADPFSLEEVELAEPGVDEVLVRLHATGVCHTDLVVKSVMPTEAGPVILGHEGAGVVEAVGADVSNVAVRDHVLLSFSSCGSCASCIGGAPAYCAEFAALNGPSVRPEGDPRISLGGAPVLSSFFGQSSFATHCLVAQRNVVKVDEGLDLATLAPLGCGIQTGAGAVLNVLRPGRDDSLVVHGAGGVGLAAVMAAVATDVGTIVAVDPVAGRRELALKLGATHAIDPTAEPDLGTALHRLVPGGASHALDTTGIPAVAAASLKALAVRGTLVLVGLGASEAEIDVQDLLNGGKTLRGCIEGDADPQALLPQLVELYQAGRFPLDELVVRYPFEHINDAVADSISGATVKPVLVFG